MKLLTAPAPVTAAPAARAHLARRLAPSLCGAIALALLTLLFFALTAADGIVSTNDGSHYALTKALAADGTVRIDRYVNYAAIQPRQGTPTPDDYRDVSFYGGHFYSDRPPGTAFLAVPFYWLGGLVARVAGRADLDLPLRYVTILPPLLGAAAALALFLLARGIGAGPAAAIATAATGALTTLLLKYATLLYSHIAGAAFVTAALAAILLAERKPGWVWSTILGGLLLGYAGVAEYPNLPLVAPVGLYLVWRAWREGVGWRGPLAFAAGWLPPVLLLACYQWIAFGRPWRTSYTFQFYFDWSRSPLTTYVTPPSTGLRWLLFGEVGLFVVTPALLLALWGLALLARRSPARAALLLGVALTILLPTAMHRTYYGGGSRDTRYLLAIVPTLYAPLALWFDWVVRPRRLAGRVCLLAGAAILAVWGLGRSYLSLLAMFGHRAAEYTPEQAWRLLGRNWRDLAVLAPGLPLLHYCVVLVIPLIGLLWSAWAWRALLRPSRG
ncbi:MAG: hypothetical protein AVDCRST_MAG18-5175 [uncultured Thermomicrobiales bacterium]|uniref:Glycosyltransferase RgtA/B/C/D-like domain-containing protein n=1 Tax=uncultured Thermomicrobiales bacterium TaxID=1645740 RepID=A0A6J4VX04_9BACT|nr:MAG: hypothetical protein AVDCRST_MAG18-5175 [uncultured Thermomicrobiales bacterium]